MFGKNTYFSVTLHLMFTSSNKGFKNFYVVLYSPLSNPAGIFCLSKYQIKSQALINIELTGYSFWNYSPKCSSGGDILHLHNKFNFSQFEKINFLK